MSLCSFDLEEACLLKVLTSVVGVPFMLMFVAGRRPAVGRQDGRVPGPVGEGSCLGLNVNRRAVPKVRPEPLVGLRHHQEVDSLDFDFVPWHDVPPFDGASSSSLAHCLVVVVVPGGQASVGKKDGDGKTVIFVLDGIVARLQNDPEIRISRIL